MRRRSAPTASGPRQARLADQIRKELALALQRGTKDPRIGLVTLTAVELSTDYAHASVYFTVLPDGVEERERCAEGLRSAAGFLRRELGRRIRIHTLPELRFRYDASTGHGMAMSRLIDAALAQVPPVDQEASTVRMLQASHSSAEPSTECPGKPGSASEGAVQ